MKRNAVTLKPVSMAGRLSQVRYRDLNFQLDVNFPAEDITGAFISHDSNEKCRPDRKFRSEYLAREFQVTGLSGLNRLSVTREKVFCITKSTPSRVVTAKPLILRATFEMNGTRLRSQLRAFAKHFKFRPPSSEPLPPRIRYSSSRLHFPSCAFVAQRSVFLSHTKVAQVRYLLARSP